MIETYRPRRLISPVEHKRLIVPTVSAGVVHLHLVHRGAVLIQDCRSTPMDEQAETVAWNPAFRHHRKHAYVARFR